MPYFNSNHTGLCQTNEVVWQIGNLTASYAAAGNGKEVLLMVSAPVVVLILVALFIAGLFGFSAVLNPSYRLLLSSALGLSLPVMSYLFSEAKDAAAAGEGEDDLSVRARVILTWMLALELLRKKVDEIRARGSSYSSTLQRAGRVVWLGSLVYFNITSPGRKAVFSILWIMCATKLLQRIVFTEVEKRSYPDKSWIISSYMEQMLAIAKKRDREHPHDYSHDAYGVLRRCQYIVMGEEKLVREVTADGYELHNIAEVDGAITVGKVWEIPEDRSRTLPLLDAKSTCLSFALFKLLRRRFEHLPELTKEEAHDCRRVLTRGLYGRLHVHSPMRDSEDAAAPQQLFQVMADELKFLSEYYHSVVPVVLASPYFVVANYLLVPVAVLVLCLIAILVCGKGDVGYVLSRMSADNYALQRGFAQLAICSVARATESRPALFFVLDLSITLLLFVIFLLEETWELLVVLTSNWFVISMLCNVRAKSYWPGSTTISWAYRRILWLRRKMKKHTNIRLNQFCLLGHRAPLMLSSLVLIRSVPATGRMKRSIIDCLVQHDRDAAPLTNGSFALGKYNQHFHLGWACSSNSVTEVILTWHVATCLLDAKCPPPDNDEAAHKVAMSLSQYCAYLVVFHPELLPDKRAKAELVLEDAVKELRDMLGFRGYYLATKAARIHRLTQIGRESFEKEKAKKHIQRESLLARDIDSAGDSKVVLKGLELGMQLMEVEEEPCWMLLADVWTELMVYAAPARDEEHVNAHADILPGGVELITVLWAFAMHTGVSRPPREATTPLSD